MNGRAELDVLIPTRNRPVELATTLAGLAAQTGPEFRVVVSDQSDDQPGYATPSAQAMVRVLRRARHEVELLDHRPAKGLAEQRAFLLANADARYVLYLDDDVWLEPGTLDRMVRAITDLRCGFVGCAVQGLSYLEDHRPEELAPYQEWSGRPTPERIDRDSPAWGRWTLHNAANPTHLGDRLNLAGNEWRAYRVAWVGGCVLYDRQALLDCGGFDFWPELPVPHAGEDVLAQLRVMARHGGAGILPSGAVHQESPTTVTDRSAEATRLLPIHAE